MDSYIDTDFVVLIHFECNDSVESIDSVGPTIEVYITQSIRHTMYAVTKSGQVGDKDDQHSESSITTDSVIIQGELENQQEVQRLSLPSRYLWALGISIALGGQYIGWNKALSAGFGSTLIATFLVASAYWCLVLSVSELSSAIPFGGNYTCFEVTYVLKD